MTMFLAFLAGCIAGPLFIAFVGWLVLRWISQPNDTFAKRMSGEAS